jgi:hypothetical protein
MSPKVANVIAIELAILIAVLVWLGISRVPSVQLHPVEARARADDSFAASAPLPKARSQNLDATNDDASGESSTEAFEEQAQMVPEDVQEAIAEPYTSSAYGEELVTESEPYYAAAYQEPLVSSPDCYVAPPVQQIVEFVQPSQIIVVSNPRLCERPHPRPTPSCDPPLTVGHQIPGKGIVPTRGGGGPPRQNTGSGLVPRQPANGGLALRQIVSARAVPQKQGLKVRFDP